MPPRKPVSRGCRGTAGNEEEAHLRLVPRPPTSFSSLTTAPPSTAITSAPPTPPNIPPTSPTSSSSTRAPPQRPHTPPRPPMLMCAPLHPHVVIDNTPQHSPNIVDADTHVPQHRRRPCAPSNASNAVARPQHPPNAINVHACPPTTTTLL
ncbi:hypothetical protein BDN71DRAFT_1505803 [Pleurotus eryngii]|uniref:Uncharacterized protein n=1 Tax=Pleurotus eryngii TaxID=5323 RepID=A0A9P6A3E8_PLEER|nr:hypothetical protein BDN71DRAFT_1505803 [Pleurotus eryngii]